MGCLPYAVIHSNLKDPCRADHILLTPLGVRCCYYYMSIWGWIPLEILKELYRADVRTVLHKIGDWDISPFTPIPKETTLFPIVLTTWTSVQHVQEGWVTLSRFRKRSLVVRQRNMTLQGGQSAYQILPLRLCWNQRCAAVMGYRALKAYLASG